MQNNVILTLETSTARGWFGLILLATLGVLLVFMGFALNTGFLGRLFLIGLGGVSVFGCVHMYRALHTTLELTKTELREKGGQVVATVEQIGSLDRGTFAFKPSNGFILRLNSSAKFAWRPGLWWRIGKRVGVGGITVAPQTKAMAEVIASMQLKQSG